MKFKMSIENLKWFMRNEAGDFKTWVIDNKLDKLLKPKEVKIFKERNMGYNDLKLFGLTEEFTDLLLYDWTIAKRKGVGDNWGTHKSKQYIENELDKKII